MRGGEEDPNASNQGLEECPQGRSYQSLLIKQTKSAARTGMFKTKLTKYQNKKNQDQYKIERNRNQA